MRHQPLKTMRELKVQCDCGQKFKFDVEPVNNQMPFRVNCPLCGKDGTDKANAILAQEAYPAAPAPSAKVPPPPPVPAGQPALRISAAAPVAAAVAAPPVMNAPATGRPRMPIPQTAAKKKNDGWGVPESDFNKIGSYVVLVPAIIGAIVEAKFFFDIDVPGVLVASIIAICGLIGGFINIKGRGPIWAGMVVGLCMALGGYGTVYFWILNRERVYKGEIALAFVIGAAPGYGLQFLLQKLLKKRTAAVA